MEANISQQLAAALLAAQGVQPAPDATAATAETASRLLQQARGAFAALALETEPSGHTAAQRRAAP